MSNIFAISLISVYLSGSNESNSILIESDFPVRSQSAVIKCESISISQALEIDQSVSDIKVRAVIIYIVS